MPLSSAAISALGSVAGSLIGGSANVVGAGLSYSNQKKLQAHSAKLNYDYSLKSARNMPSATRAGLINAGYNPMLAVQNGVSGANSSFTGTGQAATPDIGAGITSGIANAQSFQRLKNETMEAEGATDSYYAAADKAKVEKAILLKKLPWVSDKEKAEYMKTSMESAKLENDIHYQNEYLKYLENQLIIQEKLGIMGIDAQKRGQNINNATDLLKNIGLGALGLYGFGKLKYIKQAGDIVKVIPRSIQF